MKELPRSAKTLLVVVHLLALICLFGAVSLPQSASVAPLWELVLYGALAVVAG